MNKLLISPAALREMDEIWMYIADDSPTAADQFLDKIMTPLDLLARNPGVGR